MCPTKFSRMSPGMTLINVLLIVSSDVAQRTPLPHFSIALQKVFVNTSTCGIYGWPAIHTHKNPLPLCSTIWFFFWFFCLAFFLLAGLSQVHGLIKHSQAN